jgi:hypothetical protein
MYPTYLREQLHFTPADTGKIMSIYGLGVLALGGRRSRRRPISHCALVLVVSF